MSSRGNERGRANVMGTLKPRGPCAASRARTVRGTRADTSAAVYGSPLLRRRGVGPAPSRPPCARPPMTSLLRDLSKEARVRQRECDADQQTKDAAESTPAAEDSSRRWMGAGACITHRHGVRSPSAPPTGRRDGSVPASRHCLESFVSWICRAGCFQASPRAPAGNGQSPRGAGEGCAHSGRRPPAGEATVIEGVFLPA